MRLRDLADGDAVRGDFEWAVLPFPVFESGDAYVTALSDGFSVLAIPRGRDNDFSSAVLNALNAYDHYAMLPSLYNYLLAGRYSSVQEEAEMMDLILHSRAITFERVYGGDPDSNAGEYSVLRDALLTGEAVQGLLEDRGEQVRNHWMAVFRGFGFSEEECARFPELDYLPPEQKDPINGIFPVE